MKSLPTWSQYAQQSFFWTSLLRFLTSVFSSSVPSFFSGYFLFAYIRVFGALGFSMDKRLSSSISVSCAIHVCEQNPVVRSWTWNTAIDPQQKRCQPPGLLSEKADHSFPLSYCPSWLCDRMGLVQQCWSFLAIWYSGSAVKVDNVMVWQARYNLNPRDQVWAICQHKVQYTTLARRLLRHLL